MQGSFKREQDFDKRQSLSKRLLNQHPDRFPIIIEVVQGNKLKLNKTKFLTPDISVGAFLNELRKQSSLHAEEAIFLFCADNVLVPTNSMIRDIYNKHKDADGFLYIAVALENTFGFPFLDTVLDLSRQMINAGRHLSSLHL